MRTKRKRVPCFRASNGGWYLGDAPTALPESLATMTLALMRMVKEERPQ